MELKYYEIKIIKALLSMDESERRIANVKLPTRLCRKYGHPVFVVDCYNEEDDVGCYCTKCYFNTWIIVVSNKIIGSWEEEASMWHEVGHIELEEGHKDFSDEWHGLDCHESPVARTDEVAADWNSVKHGCGKELMQILRLSAVEDLRDGVVTDCLDRIRRIKKYERTGDWDAGTEHPVVGSPLTRRITRGIGIYMRCRQTRLMGNLMAYFWIKWNIA